MRDVKLGFVQGSANAPFHVADHADDFALDRLALVERSLRRDPFADRVFVRKIHCLTSDSLTMTTPWELNLSRGSKSRPFLSGMLMVEK